MDQQILVSTRFSHYKMLYLEISQRSMYSDAEQLAMLIDRLRPCVNYGRMQEDGRGEERNSDAHVNHVLCYDNHNSP